MICGVEKPAKNGKILILNMEVSFMESNIEIKLDINDLYKILKIHDLEILKKYNHTEISDRDYFYMQLIVI